MRLIDADALRERIIAEEDEIITDNAHAIGLHNGLTLAHAMLINTPTIEAEPVRYGKWIWKDFYGDGSLFLCCSECLETEGVRETANYCHNCGAKMDKED